jgi:outer membrane protein OmpA-like peptidoglycan-associated protein
MSDDDKEGFFTPRTRIAALVYVGLLILVGFLVVLPTLDGDDPADEPAQVEAADQAAGDAQEAARGAAGNGEEPTAASTDASADAATGDATATTSERAADTTDPEAAAASTDPPPTEPEPTDAPTTVAPTDPPTTPPPTAAKTYPTLPDGSPVPVVAIFNGPEITLTGTVPSPAAAERLAALALANSKTPATVNSQLTINPAVPINVGVRVIEMDSARFPEGSAEILPAHAAELDRVIWVMTTLPNITVLVVGHADQRGDEVSNFVLSEERARSVVSYLAGGGIAPARLASRAVGEADLLTLNNDAAAFALNRRTEFIFYGLLIE